MWKTLQRYRALDANARKLFWRAASLLISINVSLRLRGFSKTKEALQKRLSHNPRAESLGNSAAETVQKTCRMVKAAAHYGVVRPTCLTESLALWCLLREEGVPSQLRIGVRILAEKFEAHAWVEHQGAALNQSEEVHPHYAAFDRGFADLPGEKF